MKHFGKATWTLYIFSWIWAFAKILSTNFCSELFHQSFLPPKICIVRYLMLVEPLKNTHFTSIGALIVCPEPGIGNTFAFFLTFYVSYLLYIICKTFFIIYNHDLDYSPLFPNNSRKPQNYSYTTPTSIALRMW